MKSLSHGEAFFQSAMVLQGCEFEWAELVSAGHLMCVGYHSNKRGESV